MTEPIDIYIGYDAKEIVAYHALCQSIIDKSSVPVRFTPICLRNIAGIFNRERSAIQSTEFSFSRFLVPYLSKYQGWSLFLDCDMLARHDFAELFSLRNEAYSVMVCKHDYVPKDFGKIFGSRSDTIRKKELVQRHAF